MTQYIKTYGEPGEPKIRIHIGHPTMDTTLCGVDASGDELVHHIPPEYLPKGQGYRVTCEDCLGIIAAVSDHLSDNVPAHTPGEND